MIFLMKPHSSKHPLAISPQCAAGCAQHMESRRARSQSEPWVVLDPSGACMLHAACALRMQFMLMHEMPSIFNALLGIHPQDIAQNLDFITFTL